MICPIFRFETDPYCRRITTEVVEVGESGGRHFAVLSDTIFYPEGGGQPADHGYLGEAPVFDVQRVGGQIRHFVDQQVFPGGAELVLDWDRRYDHMQQHTAQHLLSAVALDKLSWQTKSFHLGPMTSDIELDVAAPAQKDLDTLEELVAEVVRQARPIRHRRVSKADYAELEVRSRGLPADHQGDIRLVEIENVDLNTCGGTHVASTSEVETVVLLRVEPLRGGCRLFWVAGSRARKRIGTHETRTAQLRDLLDIGDDEIVGAVTNRLDQLTQEKRRSRALEERLAGALVDSALRQESAVIDLELDSASGASLRQVAENLRERGGRRLALITTYQEGRGRFAVVAGKDFGGDPIEIGRQVAGLLDGRGGGSGGIFQGKFSTARNRSEVVSFLLEKSQ